MLGRSKFSDSAFRREVASGTECSVDNEISVDAFASMARFRKYQDR